MSNLEILKPKLDSLARCIMRIDSKRPFTLQKLQTDADLQDIISGNLERAVQQCVDVACLIIAHLGFDVPSTMSEIFHVLSEKKLSNHKLLRR